MTLPQQLVEVVAQHTIQCANEASLEPLGSTVKIGPFDYLTPPVISIAVVYVYKAAPNTDLIPVEILQRALSALLDYYPHLTGRMRINDTDGTAEIDRLGTGATLLEARCSAPLDAFCAEEAGGRMLVTSLPDAGLALMAPFDLSPESICRDPIFTVQHTRFACGGVALGIRLPHNLCDAAGFLQLVKNLATLYRGIRSGNSETALDDPPHIESYLSNTASMTSEDRQAALAFQPSLFSLQEDEPAAKPSSSEPAAPPAPQPAPPPITGRVLRFSGRELDALKARATDPAGGWVSTFAALAAHLHQCVFRARLKLPGANAAELRTGFLTPINARAALGLPLAYFPNALFTLSDEPARDVLAHGSLAQAAKAIHGIARLGPTLDEMRSTLAWIAAQPDKRRIRGKFRGGAGSIMVSQWSKFNMYEGVAFDGQDPALVAPPFHPVWLMCDGLAYFLSTEEQLRQPAPGTTLAIDVNMSLSEPLWAILDEDKHFREFRD